MNNKIEVGLLYKKRRFVEASEVFFLFPKDVKGQERGEIVEIALIRID